VKVLIVDDEPLARARLQRQVEQLEGFEPVAEAGNGQEALAAVEAERPDVVLMDIRHPMKDLDQQLIFWAVDSGIPVQVLLTKADKLKSGARKAQVLKIKKDAVGFGGDVSVAAFSSLTGIGVDVLRSKLDEWFAPALAEAMVDEIVYEENIDSENE